jgi:hypothetical protein
MSIVKDLHDLRGDRHKSLCLIKQNKELLLSEKRKMTKNNYTLKLDDTFKRIGGNNIITPKFDNIESLGLNEGQVFVVGNSVGFFDGHEDVSLKGSWTKTANEQGARMPIVKDHEYKVDNLFAKNLQTVVKSLPIRALGYDADGETEVIGAIINPYDELDYQKYIDGTMKKHSMGLQYIKIALAINDDEFPEEKQNYDFYSQQVINKEAMEEVGYFWAVQEQKALELSAVVLPSNPFTPAFTNKSLLNEPLNSTQTEPRKNTLDNKEPIKSSFYRELIYSYEQV